MTILGKSSEFRTLRERVEGLLPEWQTWYANLFDAACDLGLLRARVCDLSTLVLSRRHANVQNEAIQAFREQWLVEEPEDSEAGQAPQSSGSDEPSGEFSGETRERT